MKNLRPSASSADTSPPVQDVKNPPPKKLFVQFEVTPDEFVLYNWCRLHHRPATLAEWGKTITRRAALDQVREAISNNAKLPQHVIEALDRIRARKD